MVAAHERGIGALHVLIGLLGVVALIVAYFWLAPTWTYSAGERAGWVQMSGRVGFARRGKVRWKMLPCRAGNLMRRQAPTLGRRPALNACG